MRCITSETLSVREDILTTLRKMEPYAEALASLPAMEHLTRLTHEGSDAHYLREQIAQRGSASGMVDAALHRFREGV